MYGFKTFYHMGMNIVCSEKCWLVLLTNLGWCGEISVVGRLGKRLAGLAHSMVFLGTVYLFCVACMSSSFSLSGTRNKVLT